MSSRRVAWALSALAVCACTSVHVDTNGESAHVDAHGTPGGASEDAAFAAALRRNEEEHAAESALACEHFWCGEAAAAEPDGGFTSYPMGPVPSLDYPSAFEKGNQIFVSNEPLFASEECERVIALAESEGLGLPSSKSGKYKLGKAWIKDMPSVRDWFNTALRTKLFPALAALFPELVSSAAALRAHSVAVLKYNSSHPRTDVHVDDALLAFTVALSDAASFEGGGTYFEHLPSIVDMAQGHATFRPGAVRHGGAAVVSGLRYVIGGFIAVDNKVEHARRLNERGNRLLLRPEPTVPELLEAESLFGWGLRVNADCSLCHQNMGDVLLRLDQPARAELSIRRHLELLPRDADAHYSLGVALKAQDRTREAVSAYGKAIEIAPDDVESYTNLAAAHGQLNEYVKEAAAYRTAAALRPDDVKVWINLGIAYSSYDAATEAEAAFRQAVAVAPGDARPQLNLGRMLAKLSRPAEAIESFYSAALIDPEYFEDVKLGVGTARAQQGRIGAAVEDFKSALRMNPSLEQVNRALGPPATLRMASPLLRPCHYVCPCRACRWRSRSPRWSRRWRSSQRRLRASLTRWMTCAAPAARISSTRRGTRCDSSR